MKKFHLIIVIFFFNSVFAQSPQIQFQKSFGGTAQDRGYGIVVDNGGYAVVGHADSWDGDLTGNHGGRDIWIIQLDSSLNIIWQKALGGTGEDYTRSINLTLDGGFIISGTTDSEDGDVIGLHVDVLPYSDYWIVKTDSVGTIEWQKCLGGTYMDWGHQIIQTSDSGYIVIGEGMSTDGDITGHIGTLGDEDFWIIKLDNLGNIVWQKCFGGTDSDIGYSICQTSDGGYIACGMTLSVDSQVTFNHGAFDVWVLKIDNAGHLQWQKTYGGSASDVAYKIIQSDPGYIFIGNTDSNDGDVVGFHGTGDYWVVALDSLGAILWQRCYGGSGHDAGVDIKSTTDNGFILTGNSASNDGDVSSTHGVGDYWIVKIDSVGGILWEKSMGGTGHDEGYETVESANGGFVTIGYSQSDDGDITNNHGGQCGPPVCDDYWVVKLSPLQDQIINDQNNLSNSFSVSFNSNKIKLKYISDKKDQIDFYLYDLTGRVITLKKISVEAGLNTEEINADNLSSGLYNIILNTQKNNFAEKVIIN